MRDDIGRSVRVDVRLDAYRNFFSDDWGERITELTASATKLSEIVFDVLMEWRAAAYTVSLPVTILEHMRAYHNAYVKTGEINTTLLRLAEAIPPKLAQKIPELTDEPSLIRRLQVELVKLGAEMEEAPGRAAVEFPIDDTWKSYLEDHVYQLSLWGSQRICYVAIYNSYENFLSRAVCIAQSIDSCRTGDREFKKLFADSFGVALREKCWTASDINIARLARHALSHAGGRETDPLAKQKHPFAVVDGRIQVMPDQTKDLFSLLKDSVYALAEKAVTMPEFA